MMSIQCSAIPNLKCKPHGPHKRLNTTKLSSILAIVLQTGQSGRGADWSVGWNSCCITVCLTGLQSKDWNAIASASTQHQVGPVHYVDVYYISVPKMVIQWPVCGFITPRLVTVLVR